MGRDVSGSLLDHKLGLAAEIPLAAAQRLPGSLSWVRGDSLKAALALCPVGASPGLGGCGGCRGLTTAQGPQPIMSGARVKPQLF